MRARLLTDQKVGGSNPSGRALLRQTTRLLSSGNAAWAFVVPNYETLISRCGQWR